MQWHSAVGGEPFGKFFCVCIVLLRVKEAWTARDLELVTARFVASVIIIDKIFLIFFFA